MNSTASRPKKSPSSRARKTGRVATCAPPSKARGTGRRGLDGARPSGPPTADPSQARGTGCRGLDCPDTALRREFCAWRAWLPPGLERDTLIWPEVIAETVCAEAGRYLGIELPADYPARLAAKAERGSAGNRHFHRLMRPGSNRSGAWLPAFMRHWLCGLLHRHHRSLLRQLPGFFANGHPLPRRPA